MDNRYAHILLLLTALLLGSCSTTSRLANDEILYTGVKKIDVTAADGSKVPRGVEAAVSTPLNVKPNNPLFSPYLRTPIPMGLWAYNHLYQPERGEKQSWLYRRLAKKPVLTTDVQASRRMDMVKDILDNRGYFGSSARYEMLPAKNPKRAKMQYDITVARPWFYGTIDFPVVRGPITRRIDSLRGSSLLSTGEQYNIDTLQAERIRITNMLRNESYYYFRPEYLEYQADTLRARQRVDLRMVTAPGIPEAARRPYRIGNITVELTNPEGGEPDSIRFRGINIHYQRPLKLRPAILTRALTLRPGAPSRVDEMERTLTNLNKLGVFRYVNLNVTPLDSLRGADSLDLLIAGAFDQPLNAQFEADFSSKSNSFIGPGVTFGLQNRNFLRGGEHLSIRLKGAYEWQTGNRDQGSNSSLIHSYEVGATGSLTIPRIVGPRFVPRRARRYDAKTTFQLNASLLNRPAFFTMLSASGSVAYDFQSSPYSHHNLIPFKLTYNNLLRTTEAMDERLDENPALAQSFTDQFIPAISYTYTYDRPLGRDRLVWQTTLTEAGNLISAVQGLLGDRRPRLLFKSMYSEFVKGTTELKYYKALKEKDMLVFRLAAGIGHAYGDLSALPYSEQFYVGGSNSIRAFTIRSIGPGSYRASGELYGYLDQNGEMKLEANAEWRFRLMGNLCGALFADAGNIWLLEDDPDRPGAKLTGKDFFNTVAVGTGAGLRFDMTYLVIRADLGVALHAPYDTGRSGWYNIPRFRDGLGFHLAIGYPF